MYIHQTTVGSSLPLKERINATFEQYVSNTTFEQYVSNTVTGLIPNLFLIVIVAPVIFCL